jgi:hypothetical protein
MSLISVFENKGLGSGVDLPRDASRTRILTSYFSVDAYSHLLRNLPTRVAKFFDFFLKNIKFLNLKNINAVNTRKLTRVLIHHSFSEKVL